MAKTKEAKEETKKDKPEEKNEKETKEEPKKDDVKEGSKKEESDQKPQRSFYDYEEKKEEGPVEPAKSVEGYIIFVRNIHEEALEEDVYDIFAEYGEVKNIIFNLDRQTGEAKGYALIEYEKKEEGQAAIDAENGNTFREKELSVGWAFIEKSEKSSVSKKFVPYDVRQGSHSDRRGRGRYSGRNRGRGRYSDGGRKRRDYYRDEEDSYESSYKRRRDY